MSMSIAAMKRLEATERGLLELREQLLEARKELSELRDRIDVLEAKPKRGRPPIRKEGRNGDAGREEGDSQVA
jgi:BMFP domain-containing protein YqiC